MLDLLMRDRRTHRAKNARTTVSMRDIEEVCSAGRCRRVLGRKCIVLRLQNGSEVFYRYARCERHRE